MGRGIRFDCLSFFASLVWAVQLAPTNADGAARDLSGYTAPGVPFAVSIAIAAPEGTIVCGLEESPPVNWEVSNISNSGTWDAQTRKVKWGPFFSPSIPATVTYDVASPVGASGRFCFSGKVVFDGDEQFISGDDCLAVAIPTLSEWGVTVMALAVLTAGTWVLIQRRGQRA